MISHCNAAGDGIDPGTSCANGEHCGYSHGVADCGSCPKLPLDLIWLVDNEPNMAGLNTAYGAAIDQVHQSLKQQGVAVRTVLITRAANPSLEFDYCMNGRGMCVPPPTGSTECPGRTAEFLHIDYMAGDTLAKIKYTYKSWYDFLRAGARKVFLVVSNKGSSVYISNSSFEQMIAALDPPLGNTWSLSGVFCASATCTAPGIKCASQTMPRCLGGAPYVTLAEDTGGFAVDFCTTDPAASAAPLTAGLLKAATPTSCP